MPDPVLGVVAALGGPVVMSLGLIMWEGAWPGSAMMLNAVKNCIASLLFLAIVPFRLDTWRRGLGLDLSEGDSREDVARMDMLVLSSVLGIAISDNMWLAALRILGTRKIVLVDCVKPFVSAILSFFILGETLRLEAGGAMAVTMAGILLVSREGSPRNQAESKHSNSAGSLSDDIRDVEMDDLGHAGSSNKVVAGLEAGRSPQDAKTDGGGRGAGAGPGNDAGQARTGELGRGFALASCNVAIDVYALILTKQHGRGLGAWEISLVRFGFAALVMLFAILAARLAAFARRRSAARGAGPAGSAGLGAAGSDPHADTPALLAPAPGLGAEQHGGAGGPAVAEAVAGEAGGGAAGERGEGAPGAAGASAGGDGVPEWARMPALGRRAWALVACGSVLCTFICPALSTYAVFQLDVATFSTLAATAPISSIPLVILLKRESVPPLGALGAVVSCLGVAFLGALSAQGPAAR